MTVEMHVPKIKLIEDGYLEVPRDGRRFRFHIKRYQHDDGSQWGQVESMEEIPDVGPMLMIPPGAAENVDEIEHMRAEYDYELANPTDAEADWLGHRAQARLNKFALYDELRDRRAKIIKRSPRTLKAG